MSNIPKTKRNISEVDEELLKETKENQQKKQIIKLREENAGQIEILARNQVFNYFYDRNQNGMFIIRKI